jgi:hypothetical protein
MARVSPLLSTLAAGEVSELLKGRVDLEWYAHACLQMRNFVALTEGGATRRPPTRFVREVTDSTQKTVIRKFEFSTVQAYAVELANFTARFYANKGIIVDGNGNPISVATPWTQNDLSILKFVQSADVLFAFQPNYPVQQIERLSNTNWQVLPLPFTDGPYLEINTDPLSTIIANAASGAITLTSLGPNAPVWAATDVGRLVRLGYVPPDWHTATNYVIGNVVKNGANGVYRCTVAGTSAGGPVGTSLGIGDGAAAWDYVNAGGVYYGYCQITVFTDPSHVNATVITPFSSSGGTPYWRLGLYSTTTGFPACGDLWQQRMLMAGVAADPDRIDGSVIADYGNFTPGDTDSDPIDYTLGLSGVDAIHWIAHKRVAFAGTQGNVQKLFGPQGYDSPVTPSAVDVVEQVERGCFDLAPVRIVNGLVYVHALQRKVLELYYDFTQDLDTATELTARARHMTQGGLIDIAYQQEPYSILWFARADGALIGCTYYREQQVIAWHQHFLGGGGIVESICCIPGVPPLPNQLWLVVRRTINGVSRRYVEVMDDFNAVEGFTTGANGAAIGTPDAQLFFADSYAVYSGAPATVITGLGYLEGQAVLVMADGAFPGVDANGNPFVVQGGQITLAVPASTVYVGLDYSQTSALMPMPIQTGAQGGTPVAQTKRIDKLTVGLYRSGNFYAGADSGHLDLEPIRKPEQLMDTPAPLFTGPYELPFNGDYGLEATILLQPNGAEPMTVLWMVPRDSTNEG